MPQRTRGKPSTVYRQVITNSGSQSITRNCLEFIRLSGMSHVSTSSCYSQSNGKIERWHGKVKLRCQRPLVLHWLDEAQRLIGLFVAHFNHVRFHFAIGCITPADRLIVREAEIFAPQDNKLETARKRRRETTQNAVNVADGIQHQTTWPEDRATQKRDPRRPKGRE